MASKDTKKEEKLAKLVKPAELKRNRDIALAIAAIFVAGLSVHALIRD